MITKKDFIAPGQPVSARPHTSGPAQAGLTRASGRYKLVKLAGFASVAALVGVGLIGTYVAHGQTVGLQIIGLAQGNNPESQPLPVHGSTDTLVADLIFQPGGETGWHYHPGPVIVVIKSGSLTETHANGCVTVHPMGSVFFEMKDEIHNAANQTSGVTEVYATFLSPAGTQPLIPASNPGGVCHERR